MSDSPQLQRIRPCAPQGLSLYSISKRSLNPTLVPVCVLSVRAPNSPEGAAPQPKMSIICRACEQDFISQPNTSYFKTRYLSVCHICEAGAKLKAILVALTALREASCLDTAPEGKCQGCPLSPFAFPLNEPLLRNVIVSGQVKKRTFSNVSLISEAGELEICGGRQAGSTIMNVALN